MTRYMSELNTGFGQQAGSEQHDWLLSGPLVVTSASELLPRHPSSANPSHGTVHG
jgi:hypothetical protein